MLDINPSFVLCMHFLSFFFKSCFRLIGKLRGRHRDILCTSCSHTGTAFPTVAILHQSGTIVTVNGPTLTHHYHTGPEFTLHFTLGVVCSLSLNKCIDIVMCIHHYGIIQSIFTALKILCHPLPWQLLIFPLTADLSFSYCHIVAFPD